MKINKNIMLVFFLFVVVLISYANTFKNEFAWDDFFFIVDNIHIRSPESIPGYFAEPSTGNLYRPLRGVFYTLNYQIWELNAFGYHLNSLLLHFLITAVLFFITLKITSRTMFSFVVGLFFASHPIHTARITNMTASFDAVGILFMLSSILFYIFFSQKSKKIFYYISILFYLLAIFSTEEAITLLLLLSLYDFSFNYKVNLKSIGLLLRKYTPYIIVTILYLITRYLILRQFGRAENYFEQSFLGTILTTIKIFAQYIFILLYPVDLSTERYVKFETTILSPGVVVSLVLLVSIIIIAVKSYKNSKIVFFSIGWFFATLLPFSNFLPIYNLIADRYLYLPSYGFLLLLAYLVFQIKKIKWKYSNALIIIVVIAITTSYTILTIQRNAEWRDNLTLLTATLERNPLGAKTHNSLALYYRDRGDYKKAGVFAERAIELASKNHNAYEILGTIYAYKKEYDEAILYYKKSLELKPDYYLANNNLGLVYSYVEDFDNSLFYLKKAIETNPELAKAHNDLGTVYGHLGRFEDAVEEISRAIEINPYEADYYFNLAIIHNFLGNIETAEELFAKALELEPENEELREKINRARR